MFNVAEAKKAGATDEQIASFLAKKFDHPVDGDPEKIINKLSTLSMNDKKIIAQNDAIDEALDAIADTKPDEDGMYKFPAERFKAALEECSSKKMAADITAFTDNIKMVEKPSTWLIKQGMTLAGTPVGHIAFQTLDRDDDILEDIKNPFFSLKLVNAARNIEGQEKLILAMFKSTKGCLNNLIATTSMSSLISDAKPKVVKIMTDRMQNKTDEQIQQQAAQQPQQQQPQQQPQNPAQPAMPGMQSMMGR
jgi:hypothetical protein